jgi:dihydropteroate synthase
LTHFSASQHSLIAPTLTIRSTCFAWGTQTYIMGIINVTPDSFSGDGLLDTDTDWVAKAVEQGLHFAQAGAHILDVGGESTRPGAATVEVSVELERVLPVIRALRQKTSLPISIDTSKYDVAAAALEAGADLVNDVWGLRMEPAIANLCAQQNTPLIIMHNRSQPRHHVQQSRLGGRYIGAVYDNLLADVAYELQMSLDLAKAAGVPDEQLIIDPGLGFGKTVEQNLALINNLAVFRTLGYPVLVGPSKKSFIGYTLDLPLDDRLEGTAATVAISIVRGADIVRVHQVQEMARVARMTDAIVRNPSALNHPQNAGVPRQVGQ